MDVQLAQQIAQIVLAIQLVVGVFKAFIYKR
jgi:hypothetical protein